MAESTERGTDASPMSADEVDAETEAAIYQRIREREQAELAHAGDVEQ